MSRVLLPLLLLALAACTGTNSSAGDGDASEPTRRFSQVPPTGDLALAAPARLNLVVDGEGLLRVEIVAEKAMPAATLRIAPPPGARLANTEVELGDIDAGETRVYEAKLFGQGDGALVAGVFSELGHARVGATGSVLLGEAKPAPERVSRSFRGMKVRAAAAVID